ncbi:MAG: ATP synthase F1 subunit delta [Proteobacteria bacterium]|nr:ATP synthase F1 subunit delta [Pseudomonadota bacterium]
MSGSVIARRYGTALFDLADRQQQIDRAGNDIAAFSEMWRTSSELRRVLEDPRCGTELRRRVLTRLAERAGLCACVRSALLLLCDRKRLRLVREIAEVYAELRERRAGGVRAEVISATPLPAGYSDELKRALEHVTGRRVRLVLREDRSLIGGVITRIGDRMLDGSVRHQLQAMRERLLPQG